MSVKLRKMLSDWNARYIQSLMKLIVTQSKDILKILGAVL